MLVYLTLNGAQLWIFCQTKVIQLVDLDPGSRATLRETETRSTTLQGIGYVAKQRETCETSKQNRARAKPSGGVPGRNRVTRKEALWEGPSKQKVLERSGSTDVSGQKSCMKGCVGICGDLFKALFLLSCCLSTHSTSCWVNSHYVYMFNFSTQSVVVGTSIQWFFFHPQHRHIYDKM